MDVKNGGGFDYTVTLAVPEQGGVLAADPGEPAQTDKRQAYVQQLGHSSG
ncbi:MULTISPECIES: hypothetical protein [Kitasatospora]